MSRAKKQIAVASELTMTSRARMQPLAFASSVVADNLHQVSGGCDGYVRHNVFQEELKFAGLKGQLFKITNQLLYQLSYAGDISFMLVFVGFLHVSCCSLLICFLVLTTGSTTDTQSSLVLTPGQTPDTKGLRSLASPTLDSQKRSMTKRVTQRLSIRVLCVSIPILDLEQNQ